MHPDYEQTLNNWRTALRQPGFCFVSDPLMRTTLSTTALSAWPSFAQSWNDLVLDAYMRDEGRYRKRRHAAFKVSANGVITALPAQPHYQSLDYNPLNGGIARHFAPMHPTNTGNALFTELLQRFAELVKPLNADVQNWLAEAHQFRIEPTPDAAVERVVVQTLIVRLRGQGGDCAVCSNIKCRMATFAIAAFITHIDIEHEIIPALRKTWPRCQRRSRKCCAHQLIGDKAKPWLAQRCAPIIQCLLVIWVHSRP